MLYVGQAEIHVLIVCFSDIKEESIPAKNGLWLFVAAECGKTEEDCPEHMWL